MENSLREKLRKVRYIYSDIDGTLVNNQHNISAKTMQVVHELLKRDYKFGLVSGRPPYLAETEINSLAVNLPYIGCNGNWIYDGITKKTIYLDPIDQAFLKLFLPELFKRGLSFILCAQKYVYYCHGKNQFSLGNLKARLSMFSRATVPSRPVNELSEEFFNQSFLNLTVYLINDHFLIPPEFIKLSAPYPIQIIKGSNDCFDVCNSSNNKGSGIKRVLEANSLVAQEVLVIGDSYNDIPMFAVAGISVVLKQSDDNVKKFAMLSTELDNNHDGLAHFLEKYFLKQEK